MGGATGTWASWVDLIRWQGETGEGNLYQCITPLISGGGGSASIALPASTSATIIESLWNAQSQVVNIQSETLEALADHLGDETTRGGFWGFIDTLFRPVLEEVIEQAIAAVIVYNFNIPDTFADLIASFFVGLWEAILEALDEFDAGHKQCLALVEENNALLELSMSAENYALRANVLKQHEEIIARLSGNIEKGETTIWNALDSLLKLAMMFTSNKEEDKDWAEAFSSLESSISNIDQWVKDVFEADAGDLPVPAPPPLPPLPDKGRWQPSKAIIFLLLKLAIKLFMEWLRRHKEHDPDAAEALRKALFFVDPVDGKEKSILERGLLKSYPTEVLALLEVLDQDIAVRDATIDFGSFRLNFKGKTIQYG